MTSALTGVDRANRAAAGGKNPLGRRRVLIIAPHFPPSNLASVHRSRLVARHLPEFGWEPIILTVHHKHYEEALDWRLADLVAPSLRVERVGALPVRPVRLVGDIGVRGFVPLIRRALRLIDEEDIAFVLITVPSFFAAPIGRILHALRGVPYGIDYIDPWVHVWPGSERPFTKAWISRKLGELLEPMSVRKASLITGVAEGYYAGVLARNPELQGKVATAAMPYGGEEADHREAEKLNIEPYLFDDTENVFRMVYAGAMLPRAYEPLERVFQAISENREQFVGVRFHFIGTGRSPNDPNGYNIRPVAERYGLWGSVIQEHPSRIPYLDVLAHLTAADGAFVLGSTEPHYTPSKVYQAVLSHTPVLGVLHQESTGADVLVRTGAGQVLTFNGPNDTEKIRIQFPELFREFRAFASTFAEAKVDLGAFAQYSARASARVLAKALTESLSFTRYAEAPGS